MITIRVNEKPVEINQDFNILQLLQQVQSPLQGVAVAVNSTIILKNDWENAKLRANDEVLIIQATQGG